MRYRSKHTAAPAAPSRSAPARRAGALLLGLALLSGAPVCRRARAATDSPPPPAPAAHPATTAAATGTPAATPTAAAALDERAGVINFLGETIGWFRGVDAEQGFATEPAEMLFIDDDRQTSLDALRLAFEYARAMAALLKSERAAAKAANAPGGAPAASARAAASGLSAMISRMQEQQHKLEQLNQQAAQIKATSAGAKPAQRAQLARQLALVQSQIELVQARVESYSALVQFQTTTAAASTQGTGLTGQIDALQRSIPQLNAPSKSAAPAATAAAAATTPKAGPPAAAPDSGLLGAVEALVNLARERSALNARIDDTRRLAALSDAARAPLVARLRELNAHADALAAAPADDNLAVIRARKQQFDDLIKRHKMITDALVPLAKQGVLLQVYAANLEQWHGNIDQRSDIQFRRLILRLAALALVLLAIFVGAYVWRSLTFRYVQDLRRRRQLLQLRRLSVALVVVLVLLFDFASQLSTLATVMGLAAAGVALALQNVILSFAGYFFVTGRYGIRVGDRIQIAGISGDVIDIGLFKLALMELGGDSGSRLPTGRVVVFPNSIIFQSNGNFFKQAPGTNFVWNDFKLTLSPEADYRLAEKRLLEVVEQVYARYRDTVQRQYSNLERDLSMKFESPRPQSRLRLGPNGIELTIRYPADTRYAVQVADEISRRALDAIAHEPALSLAMPGTPNLLPIESQGQPAPQIPQTSGAGPGAALAAENEATPAQTSGAREGMLPPEAEVISEPAAPHAPGSPAKN